MYWIQITLIAWIKWNCAKKVLQTSQGIERQKMKFNKETYYSGSETRLSMLSTSCSRSEGMKLLPSGSKVLKTRRATSAGVSALTNLRSCENKTVRWVSLPITQTGDIGFFKNEPTSQYLRCSNSAKNPIVLCWLIPLSSINNKEQQEWTLKQYFVKGEQLDPQSLISLKANSV